MAQRIRKRDCPGGQWPDVFPYLRCSESNCAAGCPAQDKSEFPRHFREFHPAVPANTIYANLLPCTFRDYQNHLQLQRTLPGGGASHTMHTRTPRRAANLDLRPPPLPVWACILCHVAIGGLETTVEHVKNCHKYEEMVYDHGGRAVYAVMEEGELVEEEELVYQGGNGVGYLLVVERM